MIAQIKVETTATFFRIVSEEAEQTKILVYKYLAANLPVFSEVNHKALVLNPATRDGRVFLSPGGNQSVYLL